MPALVFGAILQLLNCRTEDVRVLDSMGVSTTLRHSQ